MNIKQPKVITHFFQLCHILLFFPFIPSFLFSFIFCMASYRTAVVVKKIAKNKNKNDSGVLLPMPHLT